jgi:hypothetical protein
VLHRVFLAFLVLVGQDDPARRLDLDRIGQDEHPQIDRLNAGMVHDCAFVAPAHALKSSE